MRRTHTEARIWNLLWNRSSNGCRTTERNWLGALNGISDEKRRVGHDVLIMGFDAHTESLEEAAAGNIYSTFFNDFMDQSQNASNTVLAFLKGAGADQGTEMISDYVSVTVDNAQEILDIAGKMQENDPDSADIKENEDEQ